MGLLRRHFVLLFSALVGVALLSSLGVWQLHRLAWKENLLAEIATRRDAQPAPLPPRGEWPKLKPEDYDYRHVRLRGVFDHAKESYLFRASADGAAGGGPGYEVVTPLKLDSGGVVFVNRGFVPDELKDPKKRAAGEVAGEVEIFGLMRRPEGRNLFTPADEPDKNLWFTRDPKALAAHWRLMSAAPFSVDADAAPNPGGWPKGGATVINIPNNHLSYALTWFALAATLITVAGAYIWRKERRESAR
ncbi:SURF1 family protein [Rhodoblastus acidophilus]|uniref:SURF1-like protein n=1 Tax=Candidatus Rhodoblastus alkanivorans TaxID=2954117 RepID=A0ABS9ZAF3_9HYPH|nr:SURF1 family protein [Candidatus Rhodoblastus alkanivorans]MCI4677267.1 SURF1 family protein [Candidatus Rhodoblastus alkanivorans]MCI4684619.1 SURF1 family protein [Candidatus Rhodoblastus alkanivorans]MDI4641941.1 SURF1 family protein [Rhodoblastus acidophilus]